jgi:hypothetical protein
VLTNDPSALNRSVSWAMIALSLAAGAVLGLWSFGGPLPAPPGFVRYDDLPRRLVRLAHIAAVMLPILNLLFASSLEKTRWSFPARRRACRWLLLGTVLLPAFLAAAAFWPPPLRSPPPRRRPDRLVLRPRLFRRPP